MAICGRPSKACPGSPAASTPGGCRRRSPTRVPLGAAQRRALGASFSHSGSSLYEGNAMGDFDGMVALHRRGQRDQGGDGRAAGRAGARVAVLDLDPDAADARHLRLACDVGDRASVDEAVGQVAADLGRLDVVVNNAGIGAQGDVAANDDDEWRRVLDVSVVGIVRVSRAALPHLRRSPRAAVVNTCSVVATLGLARPMCGQQGRGAGPHPGHGRRPRPRGHPGQLRHPGHGGDALGRPPAGGGRRPGGQLAALQARQPSAAWSDRRRSPRPSPTWPARRPAPPPARPWPSMAAWPACACRSSRGWRRRSRGRRSGCARCRPRPRSGRRPGPGSGARCRPRTGPGDLLVGGRLVGVGVLVEQLGVLGHLGGVQLEVDHDLGAEGLGQADGRPEAGVGGGVADQPGVLHVLAADPHRHLPGHIAGQGRRSLATDGAAAGWPSRGGRPGRRCRRGG